MRERIVRALALTLFLGLVAASAGAGPKTYPLDLDPLRLGNKALEEGRLSEAKEKYLEAIAASYQMAKAHYGLAEIAVREGAYAQAESFYREALAEKASYAEARAGLGLLLLRLHRDIEASEAFAQALEKKPGYWPAVYGSARILLAQGATAEAKKLLDQGASRRGAKEREDLYHHGIALYALAVQDVPQAEREALAAMSLFPLEPEYAALVAHIYAERGVPILAIEAYEQALMAPGMTPTAPLLHGLGVLYESVGRYNEAHDRLLQAVAVDSTFAPALKDLGHLYRRANQPEKAARVYLRYVTLEKKDVEAFMELAAACTEVGWFGQARGAARAAMSLDSMRVDVRMAFVRAGLRSGDKTAQAEVGRVYASLPDSLPWTAADHAALAGQAIEARHYPEARAHLEKALALDPNLAEAYFQSGILSLGTGQPDSAARSLEKAIALDPSAPLYYLNLGIAHLQARQTTAAIAPLRQSLVLNEQMLPARLLLAQALAVSDSLPAAEEEYRRVLEAEPANGKALRGLAFCLVRAAKYREAADAYQKSTEAEPGNADGWAGLGNAYLGLQDWNAAEAAFTKARALDPQNATMKRGMELLEKARASSPGGG